MARYVLDAPTLLHVVTTGLVVHADHQLVAPGTLRSQALGLLYAAVTRGDTTEREALRLHEQVTEVRVRLLGDRMSRRTAWRIATEHGWEGLVEAEYAAVTRLQADALVTVDRAMRRRMAGIVSVARVEALTHAGAPRPAETVPAPG